MPESKETQEVILSQLEKIQGRPIFVGLTASEYAKLYDEKSSVIQRARLAASSRHFESHWIVPLEDL